MGALERKSRAGVAGACTGLVIGSVGSVLHSGRVNPRLAAPAAMFMAVVLGFGAAFRQP